MLKKLSRLLISVLLMLTLAVTAFACTQEGTGGEVEETMDPIEKVRYTEGVHEFTAPDIEGKYLLKDGMTDYAVVLPKVLDKIQTVAFEEFKLLFARATGITTLKVVRDSDVTYSEDAKYISIGNTAYVSQAGIEWNQEVASTLKDDGTRIITKGESIFILGGPGAGVIYAVYDFMNICFNYEFYYRNCLEIDTGVKNLPLKAFDVTNIPDIGYRTVSTGGAKAPASAIDNMALGETAIQDIANINYRMREPNNGNDYLLPIYQDFYSSYHEASTSGKPSGRIHNVMEYCPPDHPDCEPEWFSDGGNQLCYNARGDEESLKRMKDYCARKICNSLEIFPRESSPFMNKVTLTIEDFTSHCNCTTCAQQMVEDDGSRCGAIIRFCNDVRAQVDEWMAQPENEPYRRETLQLVFFAYSAIPNPPVFYNEDEGTWEAAPGCEMAEGVGVYLASKGSNVVGVYHEDNDAYRNQVEGWASLTDILWIWAYTGYHRNATYFYDSLSFMNSDGFQYYAEMGVEYFFDEKVDTGTNNTAFKKLEAYVEFKLCWDSTLESGPLIDAFFNAMYKDAADTMKALYFDVKNHYQSVNDWSAIAGTFTTHQYPYPVLLRFIGQIDQAIADIDYLKYTDPDMYDVIKDRIDSESVSFLYAIFNIYGPEVSRPFSDEDLKMWKERLRPIAEKYVFSTCSYLSPLNGVLDSY